MSTASLPQTAPVWAYPVDADDPLLPSAGGMPPTIAEVWLRAGQVPLARILTDPAPGSATIEDAVFSKERRGIGCELVHGILVAKTMGYFESKVALALVFFLHQYLEAHAIGEVVGGDGPCETLPGQIRKPDVGFTSFDRLRQNPPRENRLPYTPDLSVEVLSPGNTNAEMEMKLKEYFASGAQLVWFIEPELRTARVFTAIDKWEDIRPDGELNGGDVLPGFVLPLTRLFEKAGPRIDEKR